MPAERPRVLVCDDDRAILELVSTRLTLAGYDVFSARDGEEAVERIVNLRPHAVVLDLGMPRLDGFGVLTKLGRERAMKTPILVLTARNAVADVQKAIGLGARDYLSKPFKDQQLLMRVARLLRPKLERRPAAEASDALAEMEKYFV